MAFGPSVAELVPPADATNGLRPIPFPLPIRAAIIVAAGVLLGARQGLVVALLGSLVAAVLGYGVGRRAWLDQAGALDHPAIVQVREAARCARRGGRPRAAPRLGCERRIDPLAVRRRACAIRVVPGRDSHRSRSGNRRTHRPWCARSPHAARAIDRERTDDRRCGAGTRGVRRGASDLSAHPSVRAIGYPPS